MRVLVTGANGFIGKEIVCELLKANYEVIEIGSKNKIDSDSKVENNNFFNVDIKEFEEVKTLECIKEADVLIHSAGLAHQFKSTKKADFFAVNVKGTENICKLAGIIQVKHFILISSVAVYGNSKNEKKGIDESFECKPAGFYAESKLESELIAEKICKENGIPLTILRPVTVIGENDLGNVSRLVEAIDNKRFIWIGKGTNSKSLIYKKDVARACLAVLEKKTIETEIFNVSAGAMKMNEIVSTIAFNLGKKMPEFYISEFFLRRFLQICLKLVSFKKIQILSETIEKWLADDVYSADKLTIAYNFSTETTISEAIVLEVNWYKDKK